MDIYGVPLEVALLLLAAFLLNVYPFVGICLLAVISSYSLVKFLWKDILALIVRTLLGYLKPAANSSDYGEVISELAVVKTKVKKNNIRSWSEAIELYDSSEYTLEMAVDTAIDRVIYLFSNKHIQVYDLITDLLHAARAHITEYRSVTNRCSAHNRNSHVTPLIHSDFLSASAADWDSTHHLPQTEYLTLITSRILRRIAPEEDNPIAATMLSAILSQNVLHSLLNYLSNQQNLLRLVILVLSDDSDDLLKSAKLDSTVEPHTGNDEPKTSDVEPDTTNIELNNTVKFFINTDEDSKANVLRDTPHPHTNVQPGELQSSVILEQVKLVLPTEVKPQEEAVISHEEVINDENWSNERMFDEALVAESNKPDEFVSTDINKFFKLAPPTPVKALDAPSFRQHSENYVKFTAPVLQPAYRCQNVEPTGLEPQRISTVPMTVMQPALTLDSASIQPMPAIPLRRNSAFRKARSLDDDILDSVSSDSGLSNETPPTNHKMEESFQEIDYNDIELNQKFLSVTIQDTEHKTERRDPKSSYTLYVILYQAAYTSEWAERQVRAGKVYRRWREFVNLAARLDKTHSKRLRKIDGPKWWQQLSLRSLKHGDIQKRRRQLSLFLKQLIADPVFNWDKDVEEFLAYNGGGEIEFVQEKVEFIPPNARLDKMVFRTVSGVMGKVTEKFTTHHGSPDSSTERGNLGKSSHKVQVTIPTISVSEQYQPAGLLHQGENDLPSTIKRSTTEFLSISSWEKTLKDRNEPNATTVTVASEMINLIIFLLQSVMGLYRSEKLTHAVHSVLLPLLEYWLEKKITLYTTPEQLVKLVRLFHQTLWPDEPQPSPTYDTSKLRRLVVQTIRSELPAPAVMVLGADLERVIHEVIDMTENEDVNRQLLYSVVDHLMYNSCQVVSAQSH